MVRVRARGTVNYGKKQDEEIGLDSRTTGQNQTSETDSLAADVAKGLMQGVQMNSKQDSADQNVLMLLQKISDQLDNMKSSSQGQPQCANGQQQASVDVGQQLGQGSSGQQMQGNQQAEMAVSEQLQQLFSQLLQGKNSCGQAGSNVSQNSSQQQQNNDQGNQQAQNKTNSMAVQTAAQVLAQAQYELSNELETSLKKLKQVISESEKIANKISNLLGEENNNQQSR